EAEHDALVAGSLAVERVARVAQALFEGHVHALRDVGRLRPDRDGDTAVAAVEANLGGVVADARDDVAHDPRNLDIAVGRDLTRDVHEARRDERLDRDAAAGILLEKGVEDRVGDLVTDLVRVTLGDRLGREEAQGTGHGAEPSVVRSDEQVKDMVGHRRLRPGCLPDDGTRWVEHRDPVAFDAETFGPTDAVEHEEVTALALDLLAPESEHLLVVALRLGGEADDRLALAAPRRQLSEDVGIADELDRERVALRLLLDLG